MTEKDQTLEEVVSKYRIFLIDTSALSYYFGDNQDPISIKEKMIVFEEQHQFTTILIDYIRKGLPCFTTSSVLEESQIKEYYPYKKIIKNRRTQQDRELLDFSRKIRDTQKERRKLIITFQENDRILELNENEQILYNIFDEKYAILKGKYKLSDVDFDFLVSGVVIAQTRESSALLSNDIRGIANAWNYILRKEKISHKKFGFVSRRGINDFEILG